MVNKVNNKANLILPCNHPSIHFATWLYFYVAVRRSLLSLKHRPHDLFGSVTGIWMPHDGQFDEKIFRKKRK
jgi:hypothetical protein